MQGGILREKSIQENECISFLLLLSQNTTHKMA